jgi:hypothetical protein
MKKLILLAIVFMLATTVSAQTAWQGYILIEIGSLDISPEQMTDVLSLYAPTSGPYPDDLLQTRWNLAGDGLIAEGLWTQQPNEALIEAALAAETGLALLTIETEIEVTAFTSALETRNYIISNVSLWELPE